MEVILKKQFIKELLRTPVYVQNSCKKAILKFEVSDSIFSSGIVLVPMEGQRKGEEYYRFRIGGYRVGIQYEKPNILFLTILVRGDMYKHFPPKK